MFAPQPVRHPSILEFQQSPQRRSSLDKGSYFELFKRPNTPSIYSDNFQGWSTSEKPEAESSDEDELDRPGHPAPPDGTPRRQSTGSIMDDAHDQEMQNKTRPRGDSVQIGRHINDLLHNEDVKQAVAILKEAVKTMDMTDLKPEHSDPHVVHTYSTMLQTLCQPKVARIINQISDVDLQKNPDAIHKSILWRMFTKVIEAGYTLEYDAYMAVTHFLMDHHLNDLAIQVLYSMPRPLWDIQAYKIGISLHLMQNPKQIEEAEWLMSTFGKPYIEVANPLAPTELPPIRIDTPLMKGVTEQDRYKLWVFYQSALNGSTWAEEKDDYEEKRRDSNNKMRNVNSSLWKDWALRRMSIETEEQRIERNKIDNDNAMIYTATTQKQYEYGWNIYVRMGEAVDEFTPRVVMYLCWRAFNDTPMMCHVSLRREWEQRAWEVYARFMCSEYLHPDQPEMPGFLCDLILITAFSPERARYTKTLSVYELLERLKLDNLLRQDQVVTPVLCVLLMECEGTPATIMAMCHKAFAIWHVKTQLDARCHAHEPTLQSLYWALLILCIKSGSIDDFRKVLKSLLMSSASSLPASSVVAIQTFHDTYLCLGSSECYFHEYVFRQIQFTDDQAQTEQMDAFGFVRTAQLPRNSVVAEPIAYVDHALHRRTNIKEPLAAYVAIAASMGAAKGEKLTMRDVYCSSNKTKSLIRHCFDISNK